MQITTNPIAASPFAAVQPADSGNTTQPSSGDSGTDSATITANDFLQLLVTEMKNQDPTANTDPNEYIDQLVQVNSLEQLISINQDLSWVSQATGGSGSGGTNGGTNGTSGFVGEGQTQTATAPVASAAGNLSATDTGPRASRIVTALGTAAQTLAPGSSGSPGESAISALKSRAQTARTTLSNPTH